MFDPEKLRQRFRQIMIACYTSHNRTLVALNRSEYMRYTIWNEYSIKADELRRYEWWQKAFIKSVSSTIDQICEFEHTKPSATSIELDRSIAWLRDAEFALRAQLSRNLLWALTKSLTHLPTLKNGFWIANEKINGDLIRIPDQCKPQESEFGRFVVGRRYDRFLKFSENEGWIIYDYSLESFCPMNKRPARKTEIFFNKELDALAAKIAKEEIDREPKINVPIAWEEPSTQQYTLQL